MGRTRTSTNPPIPRRAIRQLEKAVPGLELDGWDACPPKWVSPTPEVPGAEFSVEAVAKVIRQLRQMPHTKGRWAGTPFEPAPWQVVWSIAPVFGWLHDDKRIITSVWEEVPRKNGKSTKITRIGLVLLAGDGEFGAEVYAAAGSKDQAGFVFEPAKVVVERSKVLSGRLEVLSHLIRAPRTGGIFRVLSKAAELAHGANVHGGLIDEVHVHKDRGLIDAIETGTGAREQPLVWLITTANDGDDSTIYGEKHGYAIDLAEGRAVDPTTYIVIWAADRDDDPFSEKTWRKANPNYPISPTKRFLEKEAAAAKARPSKLPSFKRLHLNVRATDEGSRVDWDWAASAGMVVEEKLKGQPCWGGLVTRSAQDLTAICWTFGSPEAADEWWVLWRHFIPADRLVSLADRTNGSAYDWAKTGKLTVTEGDVIDVARHLKQVKADASRFDVQEMAYDPNGAIGIVSDLIEEQRFDLVPIYANSPGSVLVDWEGLVRSERYRHGANPLMDWQMGNVVTRETAGGTTKIDPKASHDVVPGAVAAEIALRRALLGAEPAESAYEDHGLMTV